MMYNEQPTGDIRATLAVSPEEARTGSTRTLTLPGGRRITVSIPPNAYNGQELHLPEQGEPTFQGGPRGNLILTITIPAEVQPVQPQSGNDFLTEISLPPPPPPSGVYYPARSSQPGLVSSTSSPQATQLTVSPATKQKPRRISTGLIALLSILAVILIAGSGLLYYNNVNQTNTLHMQATSTAQAQANNTASTNATSTAQVVATNQAQSHATATANAQSTAQAQATASAFQDIYIQATSGTPVVDDTLTQQTDNHWEEDTKQGGGGCAFTNNGYHATMPQTNRFSTCLDQATGFANFAFQVQATLLKGDYFGVIFRDNDSNTGFYYLAISPNGDYTLYSYNNKTLGHTLHSGRSDAIITGLNQSNVITIIARESNIYIFINQKYVTDVTDSTYTTGFLGFIAGDITNAADATFSHARVWLL